MVLLVGQKMVSKRTAGDPKPLPVAGVAGWRLPEAVGLLKPVNISAVTRSFDKSDGSSSSVFSHWVPLPAAGGWKSTEVVKKELPEGRRLTSTLPTLALALSILLCARDLLLVFTLEGFVNFQSKPTVHDSSIFDRFRTDDP